MRLRKEWLLGSVVALVLLSSVAFAATAVYVDDSWAGSSVGATVGNGYTFGTNAFATVQAGIDAVEAGGTVNVAAGNYPEDLRVAKSVTLRGPNAGINPVTNGAARGLEAQLESVNVPNDADINGLTIDGLKFSGSSPNGTIWLSYYGSNVTITNNIIDGITYHGIVHNPEYPSGVSHNYMTGVQITNNKITNISGGTYTALYFFGLTDGVISGNAISNVGGIGINLVNANEGDSSKLVTVTVSGNTVTNCGLQGIQMAFGAGNVTISGNTVSGANYTSASDKGGIRLYGSQFWGPVTVSGNTVTNSYNGLCIRDGENLSATAQYIAIKDNTFTSNANAAIYHGGTGTLDAKTGNNFNGAATLAGIEAQVYHYYDNSALGLVDYGQPTTLAAVYVDDDWATCTRGQIVGGHIFGHDAFATVQAGIDAVDAGGTVNVAAGTYNENVSYAKSVNVLGPNAGISPVDPTKTRVDEAVLNSITQTANASNIRISGLKFTNSSAAGAIYLGTAAGANITICDNIIEGSATHGIVHYQSGPPVNCMSNVDITDNKITGLTGTDKTGIYVFGLIGGSEISRNQVSNTTYAGINLMSCADIQVSSNTVSSLPYQGIQVSNGSGDVTVSGNTVSDVNSSKEADKGGIRLYGSGFTGPVTISGNTVTSSYNGLCIRDDENLSATAHYITIKGNTFTGNTNAAIYHGGTGTLTALEGNVFDGTSQVGASDAQLVTIEGKVYHYPDNSNKGLVNYGQVAPTPVYVNAAYTAESCDGHVWLYDAFPTVQGGVNKVAVAGTVNVAAGTYNENVVVAKQMTLQGAGSGTTIAATTTGLNITASGVSVKTLQVTGGATGVNVADGTDGVTLDQVACSSATYGLQVQGTAQPVTNLTLTACDMSGNTACGAKIRGKVDGLHVNGGHFDRNVHGLYQEPGAAGLPIINSVISGASFIGNAQKGIYAEQMSSTALTNLTVSGNGNDVTRLWGTGIDINLKKGAYSSLSISNCVVTNCGKGDAANGVGIAIKARGTGNDPSYSATPATLTGVSVSGCTISKCQEGIRLGEPGKYNTGPTSVTLSSSFDSNVGQDIRNCSTATVDATACSFGVKAASAMNLSELLALETKIYHHFDDLSLGLVNYGALGNLCLTWDKDDQSFYLTLTPEDPQKNGIKVANDDKVELGAAAMKIAITGIPGDKTAGATISVGGEEIGTAAVRVRPYLYKGSLYQAYEQAAMRLSGAENASTMSGTYLRGATLLSSGGWQTPRGFYGLGTSVDLTQSRPSVSFKATLQP